MGLSVASCTLERPMSDAPSSVGGEARLRAAFEREFAFVWRSLRRLGVAEAQLRDASQQVWIVVARRLEEIEPEAERSFLFGTALRVAAEVRRSAARRREAVAAESTDLGALEPATDSQRPDVLLDRKRARASLDRVLDAMTEELRVVFVLFELEELKTSDIAAMLGIPLGTVASRLRRAREEFEAIVVRERARGHLEGARP
jgi:RNA polymerase sigma-70 factor, ECF subfamily